MKIQPSSKRNLGFTLIELLVVIAVIGLLATVILVSLTQARQKTRDTKRKADAVQITKAIEMYFHQNGSYPASGGATAPNGAWVNASDSSWDSLQTFLKPFLTKLPKDPIQSTNANIWGQSGYSYSYITCGKAYMFVYQLEVASGPDLGVDFCGTFYQYGGATTNTTVKTVGTGSKN